MAAKDLYAGSGSGVLFTDRRDFYIDPQVVKELWTDVAPFTTVLSNKETRQTNDPLFKMFEHRNPWVKQQFVTSTDPAAIASGVESAALTVSGTPVGLTETPDSSWLGLLCEVWATGFTGDSKGVVIISVATGSADVKVKNVGDAEIDIAADDVFLVVGNARSEGDVAPNAWADELQVVYNSCQIFKTPLEITGTLLQAALRGESSELARLRAQKNQEHKMQKEKSFLLVLE